MFNHHHLVMTHPWLCKTVRSPYCRSQGRKYGWQHSFSFSYRLLMHVWPFISIIFHSIPRKLVCMDRSIIRASSFNFSNLERKALAELKPGRHMYLYVYIHPIVCRQTFPIPLEKKLLWKLFYDEEGNKCASTATAEYPWGKLINSFSFSLFIGRRGIITRDEIQSTHPPT